jgi:photosynthetic reaction center cytochrome c subunit
LLEAKTEKNQPALCHSHRLAQMAPKASQVFKNAEALGQLRVSGEFNRLMASMSELGGTPRRVRAIATDCADFEVDTKYTKVVARRMIEMTRHINADWKPHVAETGVTCYTCHRGEPVPSAIWFKSNPQPYGANFMGDKAGQNTPSPVVNLSVAARRSVHTVLAG